MGSEMDAALGAYDDVWVLGTVLLLIIWGAVGAMIMRGEESEDMEKTDK